MQDQRHYRTDKQLSPSHCLVWLQGAWCRELQGWGCRGMQSVADVYLFDIDLCLTPGSCIKIPTSKVFKSVELVEMLLLN